MCERLNVFAGMTYRHFQGIPNIMEVDCSGDGLVDSSADLLTVTLYDPRDYKVIASANLKSKECTTSASFSLCIIDEKGHRTKVRTLVLDLGQKESRLFGCNVTVTKGGVTQIRPWSIYVKADSEYGVLVFVCVCVCVCVRVRVRVCVCV